MIFFEKIKNILFSLTTKGNSKPQIIAESSSPNCPLHAIVEEDDRCTYMYLIIKDEDGIKGHLGTCWLSNHKQSPQDWEIDKMQEGITPMMPIEYCNHPKGKPKFNPENLKFVWFEEGDGVAILENGEILGVIPYWSDDQNPTYSKDMIEHYELQFPLGDENALIFRIKKAEEFWDTLFENEHYWEEFRDPRRKILDKYFGKQGEYYMYNQGTWPWKLMAEYEVKDMTYLVTIGMSLIPQPQVELAIEKYQDVRRVELAFAIKTKILKKYRDNYMSYLGVLSKSPWEDITWFGHGHTVDSREYLYMKNTSPYLTFIEAGMDKTLPQIKFPKFRGDPTNILWLEHITENDFDLIKSKGIAKYIKNKVAK